jgi:signal transduction histidine kinase
LAPVETDLHRLLNGVVDDAALLVERHGPDVSLRLGSDLPKRVLTDPNRLRQVLANLLSNAIKFTPSGSVSLNVHLHGMAPHRVGWLTFKVKDSGPGIALGEQLAVFEPFAARSSEAKQGSGLGLAISRQISNQMGGTLRLESTGPDGSVFEVFVPVGVVD